MLVGRNATPGQAPDSITDASGRLRINRVAGSDELASASATGDVDAVLTVTTGQEWEIYTYFFSFEADANVATRTVTPSVTLNDRTTALTTAPQMTGSTMTATAGEPLYIFQTSRGSQRWQSDANVESLATSQPTWPQFIGGDSLITLTATNRQVGDKSAISVYGRRVD